MTLSDDVLHELDDLLADADTALATHWPGDPGTRQPVHTLYVPADHAVDAGPALLDEASDAAMSAVHEHARDAATLADVVGLPTDLVEAVWPRVLAKLDSQPVEDLRIDLEDGYGSRDDAEEDTHAVAAGLLLVDLMAGHRAPVACGVRVKSMETTTRRRGVRSLDLVLAAGTPPGFVVTLPKVTSAAQVEAMVVLCERLESTYELVAGALRFEIQVETPQAVLGPDGVATIAPMLRAAGGRCSGLHYGTYDYSAALGVAAAYQSLAHPVADHAKNVMAVAVAQTGVRVSDGSTNLLPVGDDDAVRAAWAQHARLVRRSLERGIYQGWDLHPAQLPTRYLATYAFYREGMAAAAARLRGYADRIEAGVLDEPATARALAGFLVRGVDCGALDVDEVLAVTGLGRTQLDGYAGRVGGVARLDRLPVPDLLAELRGVCTSRRWTARVAAARPFGDIAALLAESDGAVDALDESDLDEALAGHPRIGERSESASSRQEQAGVTDDVRDQLAAANREYENRFGHVYLVCASGRSGAELLKVLHERLGNDPTTERQVLRTELGKINRLRLERLAAEGGA